MKETCRALCTSRTTQCEKIEGRSAPEEDTENNEDRTSVGIQEQGKRATEANIGAGGVVEETVLKAEVKEDVAQLLEKEEAKEEGARMKSGKESLLELLGAMKVDVTTKRKFKVPKNLKSGESPPRPNPAAMESTISMFQNATAEVPSQSETLNPEIVTAAAAAASTLPNRNQAASELLRQLRRHEAVTNGQRKGEIQNIGNIIADMKVGKKPNGRQNTRPANQIRFDDDGRGFTHDRGITSELDGVRRRKSVFSGKRLNIFSAAQEAPDLELVSAPSLWDMDLAEKIVQATSQFPRNGFEEMIQWTKEGKLWEYPINNEAGLEEEASVPFHEHIFLEKHLEEGFPQHGPVRHFMELVVAGLCKNPFLTVQQKKEHIAWFREYFQEKQNILREADVYLN
uniref:Small ribosomal subunit protein mS31 n=2 Tax=Denticeps clupeoides TaxID=299321 RepID=A0AAY4DRQ5_9TELE